MDSSFPSDIFNENEMYGSVTKEEGRGDETVQMQSFSNGEDDDLEVIALQREAAGQELDGLADVSGFFGCTSFSAEGMLICLKVFNTLNITQASINHALS